MAYYTGTATDYLDQMTPLVAATTGVTVPDIGSPSLQQGNVSA